MDDLWPGVAVVCLCLVCVTSAIASRRGILGQRGMLLMFLLRHIEGKKGTVEGSADAAFSELSANRTAKLLTAAALCKSRFLV